MAGAETVLYADVLGLINFSMDFLSLYTAGKLLSLRLSVGRMAAAAALGALYGVFAVAVKLGGLPGSLCAAAVSAAMTAAAFGLEGWRPFLRTALAVWGSGALLGGILTVLCGFFGGSLPGGGAADLYGAAALGVWAFGRMAGRRLHRGCAEVSFSYGENEYRGRALVDSGNLLTDPLSGLPVLLIRASDARLFAGADTDGKFRGAPAADAALRGGVRVVPCRTAAGTKLLYGFLCTDVRIDFGKAHCRRSAVICIDHDADSYGGCGVLLPASLLP